MPTPETCRACHEERVSQFMEGKHALAWAAMKATPTLHHQPMAFTSGMRGCGGCHFSVKEARQPQACQTCRMFLEHRMRAFQGAFHANPDYAFWYGWSELVQDLAEIKAMAGEMRERGSRR